MRGAEPNELRAADLPNLRTHFVSLEEKDSEIIAWKEGRGLLAGMKGFRSPLQVNTKTHPLM